MNGNYQNNIETLVKYILRQRDVLRPYIDIFEKAKRLFTADQIYRHRVCCENGIKMIASNMFPNVSYEERHQAIHYLHHQMEECDKALREMSQEALRDEIISKLMDCGSRNRR